MFKKPPKKKINLIFKLFFGILLYSKTTCAVKDTQPSIPFPTLFFQTEENCLGFLFNELRAQFVKKRMHPRALSTTERYCCLIA